MSEMKSILKITTLVIAALTASCSSWSPRSVVGNCIAAIEHGGLPYAEELPRVRLNGVKLIGTVVHQGESLHICVVSYGLMDEAEANRLRRRPTYLVFFDKSFSIVECCQMDYCDTENVYVEKNCLQYLVKEELKTALDFSKLPSNGRFVVNGTVCKLDHIHRHNKSGLGSRHTPTPSP